MLHSYNQEKIEVTIQEIFSAIFSNIETEYDKMSLAKSKNEIESQESISIENYINKIFPMMQNLYKMVYNTDISNKKIEFLKQEYTSINYDDYIKSYINNIYIFIKSSFSAEIVQHTMNIINKIYNVERIRNLKRLECLYLFFIDFLFRILYDIFENINNQDITPQNKKKKNKKMRRFVLKIKNKILKNIILVTQKIHQKLFSLYTE